MKVVAFLCMVILGGFVLLGRMSGDIESLREQKRTLESALRAAQDALDSAKYKVAELTPVLDKVQRERAQAADTIQALRQTISNTLQERDLALSTVEELRSALLVARQERDHAVDGLQELNLAVVAVRRDRNMALDSAHGSEAEVQGLTQTPETSQATFKSGSSDFGTLLQKDDLTPVFTLVIIMLVMGYSGARRIHNSTRKRQGLLAKSTIARSAATGVWICLPRAWTADYARWARQMQSTTSNHRTAE